MTLSTGFSPDGQLANAGGINIRGHGVSGQAEAEPVVATGVRADSMRSSFDDQWSEVGLEEQYAIRLDNLEVHTPRPQGFTRDEDTGGPSIILDVPAPASDYAQVLFEETNAGGCSWHLPLGQQAANYTRGDGTLTYQLPIEGGTSGQGERGLLGGIVKRVVKAIAFKAAGLLGDFIVTKWEQNKRRHQIRTFTVDDYQDSGSPIAKDDHNSWNHLKTGPLLLFIHGTNSQCATGFNRFDRELLGALHARYDKRVIGFDHPTLSVDPATNVQALLSQVPTGIELGPVDIVCHSRGGLVARHLIQSSLPGLTVRKVIFVATPNDGTALADPAHMKSLLDMLTTVLRLTPDTPVTLAFEGIAELVKCLAVGTLTELEGLTSMDPNGQFLASLNSNPDTDSEYSAIAADFEPGDDSGLGLWLRDKIDLPVFSGERNDLIVPTAGVADIGQTKRSFPVKDSITFDAPRGIHHSLFFDKPDVVRFLDSRLSG
jgi:pimeloyl-ACP methyl ester carboxylesterase